MILQQLEPAAQKGAESQYFTVSTFTSISKPGASSTVVGHHTWHAPASLRRERTLELRSLELLRCRAPLLRQPLHEDDQLLILSPAPRGMGPAVVRLGVALGRVLAATRIVGIALSRGKELAAEPA